MKRIYVPTRSGADWQRLLAKPTLHWKMGASAMTAAAAWEDAPDGLPKEIESLLTSAHQPELSRLAMVAAIPEWEVALAGGETTSNTDVMAICRNDFGLCVLAVEAKVLEDFGPTLRAKRSQPSSNQTLRLDYLHQLLGVPRFDDEIRYQLLHRTASALLTAREMHARTAVMLVHAFGTPVQRRADFENFCTAMQGEECGAGVWRVATAVSPTLYLAWCDGDTKYLHVQLPQMST